MNLLIIAIKNNKNRHTNIKTFLIHYTKNILLSLFKRVKLFTVHFIENKRKKIEI